MLENGKLKNIDMEVDDVEFISATSYLIKHRKRACGMISNARHAQPLWNGADQVGTRLGIAAGKDCYLVALANQLLSKPGDDSFRSSIKLWRYSLCQGSH